MKTLALTLTALLAVTSAPVALAGGDPAAAPAVEPRAIDLAICLDTSGSMENLIASAKQHIWAVVNDLALARPQPRLRVALLTFGNDGYPAEDGWVRVDTDLTEDLDLVSERLFALTTNGGTELVGRVLRRAHDDLSWSPDEDALRLVVVAGNESADQDRVVPYAESCAALVGRDVLVNSIYCVRGDGSEAAGWKDVARKADGHFAAIDHTRAPVVVESPYDADLERLSAALNATYLPVGAEGTRAWTNQAAQDANAAGLNGAAAAGRALTKCTTNYRCAWDLVDRLAAEADLDVGKIAKEDLPESMREMDAAARLAHVRRMAAERKSTQEKIQELSRRRAEHVAAETARLRAGEGPSFEAALLTAIRRQAAARGFTFTPLPGEAAAAERVE